MTQTAIEWRRLVGKFLLFLVLCWVVVLISGIGGAISAGSAEPMRFAMILIPGCAFVPAAYFAVRLHMTTDAEQVAKLWSKMLVYGAAGVVLLIGAVYSLAQMDAS